MSPPGQRSLRRRGVRRAASTSPSPPRRRWEAGRRRLEAVATAVDVALCRLQYYLDRAASYQADLQAHQPLQHLKVSSIDASFRTDVKTYLLAVRSDVSRLEAAQKAVEAAPGLGAGVVGSLARSARSAPGLRTPAGLSSSSSESDGEQGTNCRASQRRLRRRTRQTASATQLTAAGDVTESGESSGDGDEAGAADKHSQRLRTGGSAQRADPTGCGASAGGDGRGDSPPGGADAGKQVRGSPSRHHSGGTVTGAGGEATPPYGKATATEHTQEAGRSAGKCDLPVSTGEENVGGRQPTCSSIGEVKVQATGDACDEQKRGGAGGTRKSSVGTNSSSSRSTVGSARRAARRAGRGLTGKGSQTRRAAARGGAARRPSPHPLAPPSLAIGTDASATAREVLRELCRMYGLLCRLLGQHSQRLLRRTCAAALQPAEGQQLSLQELSLQQPLSRAQLERAVAAAAAELLRTRVMLCDCAVRVRAFCEVARRLRAFRPRRPPRRRKCAEGATAVKPPPAPPLPRLQPESAFSLERLLSLFLCWTRPSSD